MVYSQQYMLFVGLVVYEACCYAFLYRWVPDQPVL